MSWGLLAPALSLVPSPSSSSFFHPSSSSFFHSSSSSSSSSITSFLGKNSSSSCNVNVVVGEIKFRHSLSYSAQTKISEPSSFTNLICRAAAEYKFPDPIPEFADAETEKFRTHLLKKLPKKDIYGDSIQVIIRICTEIFNTFLHTEYGGPGTLLVVPFIDMADTLNERGLPGGPQAARTAIKWAQDNVDKDWNEWTGEDN